MTAMTGVKYRKTIRTRVTMKASAIISPKEFMVNQPIWNNTGYIKPPSDPTPPSERGGSGAYYRMAWGRTGPMINVLS